MENKKTTFFLEDHNRRMKEAIDQAKMVQAVFTLTFCAFALTYNAGVQKGLRMAAGS